MARYRLRSHSAAVLKTLDSRQPGFVFLTVRPLTGHRLITFLRIINRELDRRASALLFVTQVRMDLVADQHGVLDK